MKMKLIQGMVLVGIISFSGMVLSQKHDGGHDGHQMSKPKNTVTKQQVVEGEILDMVCFMAHDGKGKKHQKCAQQCINEGAAVGLLTDDEKVYLVIENHHKKEAYQQVKKWAAQKVKITGTIYQKGGVQTIEAEKVERL